MNNTFNETYSLHSTPSYGSYSPPLFCSRSGESYSIFYLVIFELCTLFIIPLTRQYLLSSDHRKAGSTNNRKKSKKDKKIQQWSGIMFAIFTFGYLGLIAPTPYLMCIIDPMSWADSIAPINLTLSTMYFISYMSLVFLNFFRIYLTFKHTPLKFSKILLWYYGILWTLLTVVVVSFPIMIKAIDPMDRLNYLEWFELVIDANFWLLIIMTISTAIVFIYKLVKVAKMDHNSDENGKLIKIMTKTALLTFISMIITILTFMFNTMDLGFEPLSEIRRHIAFTLIAVDVFSNFMCYVLTYQSTEKQYIKLCGCCDSKCQTLCQWIVNRENDSTISAQIQPNQVSVTTNVSV